MITIYTDNTKKFPIILNFDNETTRFLTKAAGLELERKIHEANRELSDDNCVEDVA